MAFNLSRGALLCNIFLYGVLGVLGVGTASAAFQVDARIKLESFVWSYPMPKFNHASYQAGIESLFREYEKRAGAPLKPSKADDKVGLKVDLGHGAGLSTPHHLVLAVAKALEKRGFRRENIFIVGLHRLRLKQCGYLLSDASGQQTLFHGMAVRVLDNAKELDSKWFYKNGLSPSLSFLKSVEQPLDFGDAEAPLKSFLPMAFIRDASFWINLPMMAAHPELGVDGALVNATLRNVTNASRFFESPATGATAVAEIGAIPELRNKLAFHIVSLERYQFIGGLEFNSLYTHTEPELLLSVNPVALDAILWERFNRRRVRTNFSKDENEPKIFEYSRQLGLGIYDPKSLKLLRLRPSSDAKIFKDNLDRINKPWRSKR